jgi:hypothetical protein
MGDLEIRLQSLKEEQRTIAHNFELAHARLAELFNAQQYNLEAIAQVEQSLGVSSCDTPIQNQTEVMDNSGFIEPIRLEEGLSLSEMMNHIRSLNISEAEALGLILQKIATEIDFQFHIWLLRQYITQPKNLIRILSADCTQDPYGLKIEIKRLVVKHQAADESVLLVALQAQEFDIRNDAIQVIHNNPQFTHLLEEDEEQIPDTQDLAKLSLIITQLSGGIIPPNSSKEDLTIMIDSFEKAVKNTEDEDYIEEMEELIAIARNTVSTL